MGKIVQHEPNKHYRYAFIKPNSRIQELINLYGKLEAETVQTWWALFRTKKHIRRMELKRRTRDHLIWLVSKKLGKDFQWEIRHGLKEGPILLYVEDKQ